MRSARLSVSFASPAWRIRSVSPLSSSNAAFTVLRDRERVVREQHDLGRRRPRRPRSRRPRPPLRRRGSPRRASACDEKLQAASRALTASTAPGRIASSTPVSTVTRASVPLKTFDTPRLDPGCERLGGERVLEARRVTPVAGPPIATRRQRARPASPRSARSPRTTWTSASPTIASSSIACVRSAPSRSSEPSRWSSRPSALATTRTRRAPRRTASSSASSRSVASFAGGVAHDAGAGGLGSGERVGRHRVEVADHDVDVEPERGGAVEPAVGCDDGRACGHRDGGARPRGDDDDVRLDHAFLRWHYPGQVLRVGGASAALSARSPELPGSLAES